jgi:hypothetical protein
MTRSQVPRIAGLALATAIAASSLVACGDDKVTEDVYCADKDGHVIDEKYCDDDYHGSGGGFIWIGSFGSNHGYGYPLPVGQRTSMVPYNDPVARTKAGLPATGKVTGSGGLGGRVTRSSSTSRGGTGSKAGTSKGGGFGGHGSSSS